MPSYEHDKLAKSIPAWKNIVCVMVQQALLVSCDWRPRLRLGRQTSHPPKNSRLFNSCRTLYTCSNYSTEKQQAWSLLPERSEGCSHMSCIRCVLFRVMHIIFHSNCFEHLTWRNCVEQVETAIHNPTFKVLTLGLELAVLTRFAGTINRILKTGAMKSLFFPLIHNILLFLITFILNNSSLM